ncbi:RCC1-like G exchanging factor-like protein isoform X3 [Callithrix jacchus]|uniref:RCC1-like G exchanging factor-like protein isoform X3 n=1 Tax=Callithrix jacchus TaxID=9483 RepID=UPI0023DCF28D|nr:RCC1-like G exchanging factor-like protein isoform X3 [Callithrix jacchus]
MALVSLVAGARLVRRLSGPGPGPGPGRGHWTAARRSRSRREAAEAEAEVPVFQYVGERAVRADRVFVWGFSFSGALGVPTFVVPSSRPGPGAGPRPPRRIQPVPYRLELDQKISSAACGYGFTLLSSKTTDVTKVWGMGLNKDSQLGFHRSRKDKTRGYEYVLEPSPVPLPLDRPQETRVLQVACGRAHSLVLTDREGVFSMGNNSYGQCGRKVVENEIYSESHRVHRMQDFDGQVVQVNVPRCLHFSGVGKVQEAACGGTGCAVLNGEGHVFVWGYGILGKGPNLVETAIPEMIPPTLFGLTEFNPEVRVSRIRCGLSHFAALTNKGELFVWGKNIRGCLGIGRLEDQYFPWRVTMPGEPVDVACGVDHMVTLAKSFI